MGWHKRTELWLPFRTCWDVTHPWHGQPADTWRDLGHFLPKAGLAFCFLLRVWDAVTGTEMVAPGWLWLPWRQEATTDGGQAAPARCPHLASLGVVPKGPTPWAGVALEELGCASETNIHLGFGFFLSQNKENKDKHKCLFFLGVKTKKTWTSTSFSLQRENTIHFTQQGNQLITVIHLLLCPLQESDVLLCCEGTTTLTKPVRKMLLLPTPCNSCFLPTCA